MSAISSKDFLILAHFFLYSVDMATSKYPKFCYASMLQLTPRYFVPRAPLHSTTNSE